ncbi:hypothetical protein TruAng_007262 [Truncatella angustata]|nr:hypothetical protein TruAng_007262 [Truncatella angustata]
MMSIVLDHANVSEVPLETSAATLSAENIFTRQSHASAKPQDPQLNADNQISEDASVPLDIEVSREPVIAKETSTRHRPAAKAASLWCSKKGRSHANLYDWEIMECPSCGQNLRPPGEVGNSQQRGRTKDSGSTETSRSRSSDTTSASSTSGDSESESNVHVASDRPYGVDLFIPTIKSSDQAKKTAAGQVVSPPDIIYQIRFLYEDGHELGNRPYHELLDLQEEKKAIVKISDPILEIVSIVRTNIRWSPSYDGNREATIMAEGILRNPRYDSELLSHNIRIRSRRIIDVLKRIVTYYPGLRLTRDVVTFKEPYCVAFHHMADIKALSEGEGFASGAVSEVDKETQHHLKVFREAVTRNYNQVVEEETRRHASVPASATFKLLWLIFKPGVTVYTMMDEGLQACVVKSVTFESHTVAKLSSPYSLQLWYLDFDGRRLGRRECSRFISPFDGERDITSLSVFPAHFLDRTDGGATRTMLENRGEKFFRYLRGAQVQYKGETLGPESHWYEGRAIIDISSYFTYGITQNFNHALIFGRPVIGEMRDWPDGNRNVDDNDDDFFAFRPPGAPGRPGPGPGPGTTPGTRRPGASMPPFPPTTAQIPNYLPAQDPDSEYDVTKSYNAGFPWREYEDINPKKTHSLEIVDAVTGQKNRHRYLLCPRKVIGFTLKSRIWEQLDIDCCQEPRHNPQAVDALVMPDERKLMIKALVYQYSDRDQSNDDASGPWAADFIEHKECIAESTGRPLLSLTIGDLGTNVPQLESKLYKWFRLGEIWGAVMLLDEADVFLERRATSDLHRNSLVSVFLRTMEYYRGILFLTTNRVGHFDDAFVSRIHVVLHYESFSATDRERIWTQFFEKLKRERGKFVDISRAAKKYVLKDPEMTSIPWNGREIRNTFQTAVALAEFRFTQLSDKEEGDKACLEREDFEKVCEMTGAFKKYLQSVSGFDEAQRARNDLARNDQFADP